ncbi:KGK domain-containing protein [Calothrix sp. PCC 7507]|uniref:KGK domain-containing protein n=1 Tax=Calothrix sp. PCC 7507 TaxID=99598 RepID=UPI0002E10199|nr:KGK domain-containing protein [Calothrix sp. PCC 7507]
MSSFDLNEEDVVMTEVSTGFGFGTHKILKFSELRTYFLNWVKEMERKGAIEAHWFKEGGLKCQVLPVDGGGWHKGQLRFRMEFIPDDPESFFKNASAKEETPHSPLADLRSNLDI